MPALPDMIAAGPLKSNFASLHPPVNVASGQRGSTLLNAARSGACFDSPPFSGKYSALPPSRTLHGEQGIHARVFLMQRSVKAKCHLESGCTCVCLDMKRKKNQVLGGKALSEVTFLLGRRLLRPYSIIQSLLTRTSLSNAHGMSGLFASGIQWKEQWLSSILVSLSLVIHLRPKGCIYHHQLIPHGEYSGLFYPPSPK
jgi:hypothetical protein